MSVSKAEADAAIEALEHLSDCAVGELRSERQVVVAGGMSEGGQTDDMGETCPGSTFFQAQSPGQLILGIGCIKGDHVIP